MQCNLQEQKLTRVASYRHLHALSHQVKLLTGGRLANLDSFSAPEGVIFRAVKPGEQRLVRQDGSRRKVVFQDVNSGVETSLLPEARDFWIDVPLLVLQLDQGPTCCASSALLGFHKSKLQWL